MELKIVVQIHSFTVVGRNMKLQPDDLEMLSVLNADDKGTQPVCHGEKRQKKTTGKGTDSGTQEGKHTGS